jgi:hypothetical protein
MPLENLQRQVAAVVLAAAAEHGFALAGGCALIAHGLTDRLTEDIDLFTDDERGVQAATQAVEDGLRAAGFRAERQDKTGGLADVFPGMGDGLAEWIITAPDGRQVTVQMSYFERGRKPVLMDVGPVLDLDDVVAGKVVALASRAAERDYLDVAAAIGRGYQVSQLIRLAGELDPGLTHGEFSDAGRRLDRLGDRAFARYGLSPADVARLRMQLAGWPRS